NGKTYTFHFDGRPWYFVAGAGGDPVLAGNRFRDRTILSTSTPLPSSTQTPSLPPTIVSSSTPIETFLLTPTQTPTPTPTPVPTIVPPAYQHNPGRHLTYWSPSGNIQFKFTNGDATWLSNMRPGITAWNNSNANVSFSENASSNNTAAVLWIDDTYYGVCKGWTYAGFGPRLTRFAIEMNSKTLPTSYITSVFAHELGHTIGLLDNPAGQSKNSSLMNYDRDRSIVKGPTAFDTQSVNMLYRTLADQVEQVSNITQIVRLAADYPQYDSITHLASNTTDIIRAKILDERVGRLDVWLEAPPSDIETSNVYTIYRVQVLDVYQGSAVTDDILEVRQQGGQLDGELVINSDHVAITVDDELVLFLQESIINNNPYVLVNSHQSAYDASALYDGGDGKLESVNPANSLLLTLEMLKEIADTTPGDANHDGLVNIDDILFIRDIIFGVPNVTLTPQGRANLGLGPDDPVNIDTILYIRDKIFGV
ncbi:MAG: hypothetical protein FWD16_05595, partial [Clostridia bacterium]|nr:hypothetical protein [Clostridia bacterium]